LEKPVGERLRSHGIEDAAQEDGESSVEISTADGLLRPVEVPFRCDDKLDLILGLQQLKVRPDIVLALFAIGTFQVHDDANWHRLTPSVRHAMMELVQTSQRANRPLGGLAVGDTPWDSHDRSG